MSVTVTFPVAHKRTYTVGKVPSTGDIIEGQIFINLPDKKLFTKDQNGVIFELGVTLSQLATVATSGSYNDLANKPTIPPTYTLPVATTSSVGGVQVGTGITVSVAGVITNSGVLSVAVQGGSPATGAVSVTRSALGLDILDANNKILTTYLPDSVTGAMVYKGTYNAETGVPTIPSSSSDNLGWLYVVEVAGTFTNTTGDESVLNLNVGDWLVSDGAEWQQVPYVAGSVLSVNDETGNVTINATSLGLATVATSGSYNDLANKPVLATVATSGSYNDLANKPVLSTVATSGSYNDLTNLPPDPAMFDLGVSVSGAPVLTPATHPFTRAVNYAANFAGSVAVATLSSGTTATVRIMKALAATPTVYNQVGTLVYDTSVPSATFTSTSGSPVSFDAGDILQYQWATSTISSISITLHGERTS